MLVADLEMDKSKYGNKNILFVGVDWERKGGPELIKAFGEVLKVYPDAQLTIVGCTPNPNISNINIVGCVTQEDVNSYYEKASVFCLPSRLDPSTNVVLEASAHALPVVATDVGGTPDRVLNGETGYLVKPGDVGQLAEILIELIGHAKKCQDMGEKGRHFVLERYNWEKVGAEITKRIVASRPLSLEGAIDIRGAPIQESMVIRNYEERV